ncbi:MAG: diacylglycerol/polyprenol kinase family protein [Candidatus Methanoperedens sp.]
MNRQDLIQEIKRKAVHLTSIIIVLTYHYYGKENVLLLLITYLVVILGLEYFRIEHGHRLPVVHTLFRIKEADRLGGHVFFTIGSIIAVSVFSKEIASAAILMTTFGDASAAIFGKAFGRTWIKGLENRAYEGCAAEFIADIIIGSIFLQSWIAIFVMAGTATIVETITDKLDDNLLIPIFSGFIGQLTVIILTHLNYLN